jgi:signal peptidase I
MEDDRRPREDARCGAPGLSDPSVPVAAPRPRPWRVAVTEASMLPAIAPGDWLVVDPRRRAWPKPGSVVVFIDPMSEVLSLKRVAAGPGERVRFADGFLTLAPDEAWLVADADEKTAAGAGFGPPIDSNRFGPVSADRLVGRVVFRYWPPRRFGRIPKPAR